VSAASVPARLALAFGVGVLALACRASAPVAADWPAITAELHQRVELDQTLRRQASASEIVDMALFERIATTDADNTAWMKQLVDHHGWPTLARVGAEGAGNAWLLVQHADHDVDFQERCLVLLRAATAEGQADRKHLAYLEDRVAMHRDRPQRYGTQFVQAPEGAKGFVPYTLEDSARVDEWRASVGLEPLADYARRINGKE